MKDNLTTILKGIITTIFLLTSWVNCFGEVDNKVYELLGINKSDINNIYCERLELTNFESFVISCQPVHIIQSKDGKYTTAIKTRVIDVEDKDKNKIPQLQKYNTTWNKTDNLKIKYNIDVTATTYYYWYPSGKSLTVLTR